MYAELLATRIMFPIESLPTTVLFPSGLIGFMRQTFKKKFVMASMSPAGSTLKKTGYRYDEIQVHNEDMNIWAWYSRDEDGNVDGVGMRLFRSHYASDEGMLTVMEHAYNVGVKAYLEVKVARISTYLERPREAKMICTDEMIEKFEASGREADFYVMEKYK